MSDRREERRAHTRNIRCASQLTRLENWNPTVENLTALSVAVIRVADYLAVGAARSETVARNRAELINALKRIQTRPRAAIKRAATGSMPVEHPDEAEARTARIRARLDNWRAGEGGA